MKDFFETMGYNTQNIGDLKSQAKMLAQLLVIGAIMSLPLLLIMVMDGWLKTICE